MTFFVPGGSRCPLCGTPIATRVEATRLPFVHPQLLPAAAQLADAFVHRRCWEGWPDSVSFAEAADETLARAAAASPYPVVARREGVVLSRTPATREFRLHDLRLSFVLDAPSLAMKELVELIDTLENAAAETTLGLHHGRLHLRASRHQDSLTLSSLTASDEAVERVTVPLARWRLWGELLRAASFQADPI